MRTSPAPLARGSVRAIDRDTAYWAFRIARASARGLPWASALERMQRRQRDWEARGAALVDRVRNGEATLAESEDELHEHAAAVVSDWWALLDELLLRYGDGWEHEWDEDGRRLGKPVAYPAEWLAKLGFAQGDGE